MDRGYSPCGGQESDMTEQPTLCHTHTHKKNPKHLFYVAMWYCNPTPRHISGENSNSNNTCIPMFIAALFTIAKTWKQYMPIDRWKDEVYGFCVYSQSLGHVWLFATAWTVACQPPLSVGFFRQEQWSGLRFPPPADLPNPGIELASPALAGGFFTLSHQGSPCRFRCNGILCTNC